MTAEALKQLLATPVALFVVMLLGSLANGLKQLATAKQSGTSASFLSYLGHWPETLATVILNALAFATLLTTDQLNFASALGIGFAANSASDLLRAGGRSAALGGNQGGFASLRMLLTLLASAIVATVLLAGCKVNPDTGQSEISETGKATLAVLAGELTDRYLAESPDRARSIANIRGIAVRLQAVTDVVTITDLRARLDVEVAKLNLSDLDRRSVNRFLPLLEAVLRDYIGRDELDSKALVRVNEFLNLILLALPPS